MKRYIKGSFTIEASVIVPLILLVFVVSINGLFYYHDRSVIGAVAYETVTIGSERREWSKEDLETYFQERIGGRTLLFTDVAGQVEITDNEVSLVCEAKRNYMSVTVRRIMRKTEPEKYIRNIRKIEKIQGELERT